MSSDGISGTDWSDREIDLIIADYFDMLRSDLAGQPYIKSHHNASLDELIKRGRGSIEFKHRNISAILEMLGMPWIKGYLPARNFQRKALVNGVDRYLTAKNSDPLEDIVRAEPALAETAGPLFVERPPVPRPSLTTADADSQRLIRKFDPAARDERNRKLGKSGEERVFFSERARLRNAGLTALASRVRWVSQEDGDGAGYDILSFTDAGEERLLEVKTTTGHSLTPFFLSANEYALSDERPENFRIHRLYDFARDAKVFEIAPPLRSALVLETANYRASFS